jgi:RNA polymerase sigma-70 factor (ECF subfamily)
MPAHDRGDTNATLDLVRRAQIGELEAFDRLFETYYGRVLALVRRRMGRELRLSLDSSDLLQEAMIQAIRGFDQFEARDEHALLAWFARIVENRIRNAADYHRADKRDRKNEVVLEHLRTSGATCGAPPEPPDQRTQPFENLARKERADVVAECLAELPERRRRIVELRNKERRSWEEIAEELGAASAQSARMLYSRAMVELKEKVVRRLGGAG